jgi:cytochrome c biogenesis protein CcdA
MKKVISKRISEMNATPVALIIYSVWWGYVIYFLYWKDYDNNAAGAWASVGIGLMTLFMIIVYLTGFIIASFKDRPNRSLYLVSIGLILTPLLILFVVETLK